MTGAGDFAPLWSTFWRSTPLLANAGYADLFCFIADASKVVVSTLREPVGGRVNGYPLLVLASTGVDVLLVLESWLRLAEIRARSDTPPSLGSLLVLKDLARPSGRGAGGGGS